MRFHRPGIFNGSVWNRPNGSEAHPESVKQLPIRFVHAGTKTKLELLGGPEGFSVNTWLSRRQGHANADRESGPQGQGWPRPQLPRFRTVWVVFCPEVYYHLQVPRASWRGLT